MSDYLPDWLISCFCVALLGEIYPQIRAIAVSYSEDKELLLGTIWIGIQQSSISKALR